MSYCISRIWCALAAGALGAQGIALASAGELQTWTSGASWTLAGALALAGTLAAALRVERGRVGWAWRIWAAASVFWLAGAVVREMVAAGVWGASSAADVLWLLFALLGISGLAYRSPSSVLAFRLFLLDALPIALLAAAVVWIEGGHSLGQHPWPRTLVILYPCLYTLLALIGLQLTLVRGLRRAPSNMLVLAPGFLLTSAAALAWSPEALTTGVAQGAWQDALWTLGLLVVSAAGLRRALAPAAYTRVLPPERDRETRSLLPIGGTLGLIVLVLVVPEQHHRALYWFLLASLVALAARFYLARAQLGRSQAALELSERRFRSIFESAAIGSSLASLEGRVIESNDALARMLGYEKDELRGLAIADITYGEDAGTLELLRELIEGARDSYQVEKRYVRKDGSVFWARVSASLVRDERGRPEFLLGMLEDVNEQKQAEERLAEAERRYRALVEQLPLATYLDRLDEVSSNIYTSPQIEAMLGYPVESWREERDFFPKILHPDDRERVLAEHARLRATWEPLRTEYRVIARDGRVVWLRDEGIIERDEAGRPLHLLGFLLDVTERKHAEAERERLLAAERAARADVEVARAELVAQNEQLRALDRMKDEFVALVSHELRTPLTSILGYLELVSDEGGKLSEEQRDFLSVVERNAQRLLRLVGDLLLVAQIESGKLSLELTDADLVAIAGESVQAQRPRAEAKAVEIAFEVEAVPVLRGDRARLAQLLDNLVSNAVKFTLGGGQVRVRISKSEGGVLLAVADSGIGIPAAEQERLFERFFRASTAKAREIQGTGLGLTITKAIAEGHGGRIWLESEEGVGTTFYVELPLVPADTAELDDADSPEEELAA